MALTAPAPAPPAVAPARPRRWLAAYCGGVLAAVLPYGAGVLLPYYVNGLHRLPLAEVASGRHDPKDLWPSSGQGCGGLLDAAGLLSLAWTPLALVALVALGPVAAWSTRHRPWLAACFVALAAGCVAALGWLMGPTSAALAAWRLD